MRKQHVDTILKAIVSTRHCLRAHKFQWEIFFIELYLKKLGLSFDDGRCPFCGRVFDNLFLHLTNHKSKCYQRLRYLISYILDKYSYARAIIEKKHKRNKTHICYCRICGLEGYYYNLLVHVLEEHIKNTLILLDDKK